ncbi:MAG: hypothetical protein ACRDFR_07400, partial [Candidatus Limnocylindria bacterium]
MTTEFIFLIVSAAVAGLIVIAGLFAVLSGRSARSESGLEPMGPGATPETPARDKYLSTAEPGSPPLSWLGADRFRSTVRAIWWVTIAGVLISVGLTDVDGASQAEIVALGGLAVIAVVVFHELIPDQWRSVTTSTAEVASAIGLLGALVILTGRGASPFAPLLVLPVLGVALGGRPTAGLAAALAASLAYVVVVVTDPGRPFAPAELLPAAVVLGIVWLSTVSAVVFAAQQRRLQAETLTLSVTDPLTGLFNR